MLPFCMNKSPRRLCEEIEKVLPPSEQRMVRRPFNHYAPTMTDWWIVPSLELPFFKFGKYYFSWDEHRRDEIRCGYFVTKGMDPMLKSVFSSKKGKRLLMDDSWGWNHFLPALRDGRVEAMIREGAERVGNEVEIIFDGGYIDDPGVFDPQTALGRRDRYTLRFDPKSGALGVKGAKRDAMTLKFLNKVRDWKSFYMAVDTLAEDSFMWCDCFVANVYRVREYGEFEPDETVRSSREIYDSWLAPFRELVL